MLKAMEIELKYSSPASLASNLRKPEEVETTQSTFGIDITITNRNNNQISSSLPIDTYNNLSTTLHTTNPIPITRVISSTNSNRTPNNKTNSSSSSIGYVAWDFAGQLEYSTLHPVTN